MRGTGRAMRLATALRPSALWDRYFKALAGLVLATLLFTFASGVEAKPLRIVALGDSLTAGYGIPASKAFPVQLEDALKAKGHDVEVENAGVSGETMAQGLARLDWSVPEGTDAVIVALGANDMLRGLRPETTSKALDEILARLKARNLPVLLAGMRASPNLGAEYTTLFDAIFPQAARTYGVAFYPFFLEKVVGERDLNQADGLHPNPEGVAVIVAGILPKVEELIAQAQAKAGAKPAASR